MFVAAGSLTFYMLGKKQAIMAYLDRHGLRLLGAEVVDIGSWKEKASHAISICLSPLHIHVAGDPKMTLEQFWQERKCLAVWVDE
jgi:hypothetical protein